MSKTQCKERKKKENRHSRVQNHKVAVSTHISAVLNNLKNFFAIFQKSHYVLWESFTFVMSKTQCKERKKKENRHSRVQNHKVAVSTHISAVLNNLKNFCAIFQRSIRFLGKVSPSWWVKHSAKKGKRKKIDIHAYRIIKSLLARTYLQC